MDEYNNIEKDIKSYLERFMLENAHFLASFMQNFVGDNFSIELCGILGYNFFKDDIDNILNIVENIEVNLKTIKNVLNDNTSTNNSDQNKQLNNIQNQQLFSDIEKIFKYCDLFLEAFCPNKKNDSYVSVHLLVQIGIYDKIEEIKKVLNQIKDKNLKIDQEKLKECVKSILEFMSKLIEKHKIIKVFLKNMGYIENKVLDFIFLSNRFNPDVEFDEKTLFEFFKNFLLSKIDRYKKVLINLKIDNKDLIVDIDRFLDISRNYIKEIKLEYWLDNIDTWNEIEDTILKLTFLFKNQVYNQNLNEFKEKFDKQNIEKYKYDICEKCTEIVEINTIDMLEEMEYYFKKARYSLTRVNKLINKIQDPKFFNGFNSKEIQDVKCRIKDFYERFMDNYCGYVSRFKAYCFFHYSKVGYGSNYAVYRPIVNIFNNILNNWLKNPGIMGMIPEFICEFKEWLGDDNIAT